MLSQTPEAITSMKDERQNQINYWKSTGILKFELEQVKKDSLKNDELNNKKEEKKVILINGTKTSNSPMVRRKTNITNLQNKVGTTSGIKRRFSQIIGEFSFLLKKQFFVIKIFFFTESPTRAGTNATDASKPPIKRRKSVSVNLVSNKKMSLVVTKVNSK